MGKIISGTLGIGVIIVAIVCGVGLMVSLLMIVAFVLYMIFHG